MILIMVAAIIVDLFFPATQNRDALHVRHVNEVKAESGWEMLTDRASIVLPKNLKAFERRKVREVFRRGDAIEINIGVNGQYNREFTGYISESPSADDVVSIKCEDEMWKLKQIPVNVCMPEGSTLKDLLTAIAPGYNIDVLDIKINGGRYSQTTVAEVLEDIEENFGFKSYFQDGKLVVGKIYLDNTATHKIHLEKQVYANNLKFKRADDRLIKIKAVNTKDGKKTSVEVGDEGGELQTLTFFNVNDEKELKKLAQLKYDEFKVDGYDGTIDVRGWLQIKHGDKIQLVSDLYPEQDGTYYVDKVDPKLNDSPEFIKTLAIGPKVA